MTVAKVRPVLSITIARVCCFALRDVAANVIGSAGVVGNELSLSSVPRGERRRKYRRIQNVPAVPGRATDGESSQRNICSDHL